VYFTTILRFLPGISLSLIAVLGPHEAHAQYDPVSIGNWQLSSNITYVGGLVLQEQQGQQGSDDSGGQPTKRQPVVSYPGAVPAASAKVALTYTPSLSRRNANIQNFVAANRAVNPALGAELERVFAANDIIATMGREIDVYGLRIDNIADAFTVYWITSWEIAHGLGRSETNKATVLRVKEQVEHMMRSSRGFAAATEAERQEMSETWFLQAALLSPLPQLAADEPSLAKLIANNVRKTALASGLDLDAMTLTEQGFVPVKRR
jgi:hypothetical protein